MNIDRLHQADSRSRDSGPRLSRRHRQARGRARRREPGDEHFLRERAGNGAAISRSPRRQDHGHLTCGPRRRRRRAAQGAGAAGRRRGADRQATRAENPDPLFVARALAAGDSQVGRVRRGDASGARRATGARAKPAGCWPKSWACRASRSPKPSSRAPTPARVRVKRQTDSGWELFEVATPLVVTITNHDKNVPRIPKTRDVMQSYRKPLAKWTLAELGIDPATATATTRSPSCSFRARKRSASSSPATRWKQRIDAFARRMSEVMRSI